MDKWFFYGAAGTAILIAIFLLIAGPAKGEERQYEVQDSWTYYKPVDEGAPGFTVHEFTPKSAQAMQCVFVSSGHRGRGGVFCWPKIMNDSVQRWINRAERYHKEEQ